MIDPPLRTCLDVLLPRVRLAVARNNCTRHKRKHVVSVKVNSRKSSSGSRGAGLNLLFTEAAAAALYDT
jgi:hypothetical protein